MITNDLLAARVGRRRRDDAGKRATTAPRLRIAGPGRRRAVALAAAAATGLALLGVAGAPVAQATTPIVSQGDVLVTDFGNIITGASVDKVDAANLTSHRVTSFFGFGAGGTGACSACTVHEGPVRA